MEKRWDNDSLEQAERDVSANINEIRDQISAACAAASRAPSAVKLMAVTKTVPPELVNIAIRSGINLLGENRAQELLTKYGGYEKDSAEIHFIGHLQSNKVRQIIDKVDMIHSVDRLDLVREINNQALKHGKVCDILLEVNIGNELSKSGISPAHLHELAAEIKQYTALRLRGLMAIPPFCDDISESERYFSQMNQLFIDIKDKNRDNRNIDVLSMGMSGDFPAAIKHGATIIRIGTAIFGERT